MWNYVIPQPRIIPWGLWRETGCVYQSMQRKPGRGGLVTCFGCGVSHNKHRVLIPLFLQCFLPSWKKKEKKMPKSEMLHVDLMDSIGLLLMTVSHSSWHTALHSVLTVNRITETLLACPVFLKKTSRKAECCHCIPLHSGILITFQLQEGTWKKVFTHKVNLPWTTVSVEMFLHWLEHPPHDWEVAGSIPSRVIPKTLKNGTYCLLARCSASMNGVGKLTCGATSRLTPHCSFHCNSQPCGLGFEKRRYCRHRPYVPLGTGRTQQR